MKLSEAFQPSDYARVADAASEGAVVRRQGWRGLCPVARAATGDWSRSRHSSMAIRSPQSAFRNERAFTMVEIALSLAIIGFALVAILGVLPTGLQVQRENREETIIGQDATVWINTLRNGDRGCDDLTNYVDAITNVVTTFDLDGNILQGPDRYGYTYTQCTLNNALLAPRDVITNGARIIGLLSTPKFIYHALPGTYFDITNRVIATSNYITAYVHAMSGAAVEKTPQNNADVRDLAFRYRMVSEVVPYAGWDTNWVQFDPKNLAAYATNSLNRQAYESCRVEANRYQNLSDIRLLFRWPLLPKPRMEDGILIDTGKGRQAFRVMASGDLMRTNDFGMPVHFFTPHAYVRYP